MRKKVLFGVLIVLMVGVYFSYDRLTRPYFLQDLHHFVHATVSRVSIATADRIFGKPKAKPLCYADEKKLERLITTPHEWVVQAIAQGFANHRDARVAKVRETFNASVPEDNLVLYHIADGGVMMRMRNEQMNGACVFAAQYYQRLFADLATRMGIKKLTFLLRLSDRSRTNYDERVSGGVAPILAVTADARHPIDGRAILIPDYQNLLSWPRMETKIKRANEAWPWEMKKDIIFWRGGPADVTGYRHQIIDLSKRLHRDPIDAQFTYGALKTAERIDPPGHVPYKYQLTIDGHTAAWERPVWQLYSNCVVLKQASPYVQWYYHVLTPGVHFVEVPNDPGALLKTVRPYSDAALKAIANHGHAFARDNLSTEDMIAHIALVLKAYAEKQNSPVANPEKNQ